MKVALLSCGPSLKERWQNRYKYKYDFTIGVNTAGWLYEVDMLACLDKEIILDYPKNRPFPAQVLTHKDYPVPKKSKKIVSQAYNIKAKEVIPVQQLRFAASYCNYTFPQALWYIGEYFPEAEVDVFGFDIAIHSADVVGKAGSRGTSRWRAELPWIRFFWQKEWNCMGNASQDTLDWIIGNRNDELHRLIPDPRENDKGRARVIETAK